ncbi:MAG TPA: hypothetical protein VMT19_05515 [Thermoanaerobaculaceae bacterium]|nr:hypothetical protein [Thermoanaerobaculaceae bacterium]
MNMPTAPQRLDSFYASLQRRVEVWLASDEAPRFPHAELYRHLPDLYRFLASAALDPRVPQRDRTCALSTVKYVVAPYDLIPEAVEGTSGFRDDLVLAAMATERLCGACEPQVVGELWTGVGDPRDVAHEVLAGATAMVGPEMCERLRGWLPA